MRCPACASDTEVVATRAADDRVGPTRRRRTCKRCDRRFSTLEVIVEDRASEDVMIVPQGLMQTLLGQTLRVFATRLGMNATLDLVKRLLGREA